MIAALVLSGRIGQLAKARNLAPRLCLAGDLQAGATGYESQAVGQRLVCVDRIIGLGDSLQWRDPE